MQRLRECNYEPICIVSDDHTGISSMADEEHIPHQLCIFHLLKTLRRIIIGKYSFTETIPDKYKVLYSRIKWIFKTKTIEDLPKKINQFRSIQFCWRTPKQKNIIKWFWKVLPKSVMRLSFVEKVPSTSNLLENLNGQIEQRIKTFRGVKSEESLIKILKILFFLRNFK